MEMCGGERGLVTAGWRHLIVAMRRLVEVKRRLGKEAEAQLMELDLDETEAIMASMSAAALTELQEEMQAEEAAGQEGQAEQQGKKKKGKPTRKQQKRKAAQRRRAEAEQEQQQAAAAAAAGGAGAAEEGQDEVGAVTAAAAQLQIDEPELEPEPDECAICLNDLPLPGEEGAVLLVCTHVFHTVCLDRWKAKCLEKGLPYTCAMCRGTVVAAAAAAGGEA